ncbi:MAG: hypothetical protein CVV64_05950 [Candidatus Wallbacteria bacterium HGW-Wallbacteria-1]|jgi:HEAT repeat protein|uniref:Protein unc-45 homolog B n=1 Tax=Candidatus Wallbacteria bacterium HGW-Wallbacteria-1 TaxID=2013854 RepID=A0A2N1PSI7_9BACT|nr:MAG: hypothetical protein CVV64_05950 [Candidatus Wallbacteria bacterium HGW-Wallbacteria-1]
MFRTSQEVFRLFNKDILELAPVLENYSLFRMSAPLGGVEILPPPLHFLKSFRSSLKKSLYALDSRPSQESGQADTEDGETERTGNSRRQFSASALPCLNSRIIPFWLRSLVRDFFEPYDARYTANFNLPKDELEGIHQFIYTVELARDFITPALELCVEDSVGLSKIGAGDLEKSLKGLKFGKRGEVLNSIETLESLSDSLQSPVFFMAAGLMCLHPFLIDRERALKWLNRSVDEFERGKDPGLNAGGMKISAQGFAAMITANLMASFGPDRTFESGGHSLRKLRQFATTSMAKYASRLLKNATPDNIRSAAFCYYLAGNIGYLSPSSDHSEHAVLNLQNAILLLGKIKGRKFNTSIGNLLVLTAFYRLASLGDDIPSNLSALRDVMDILDRAAESYSESSSELEFSIRYRSLLCSRAVLEMTQSSLSDPPSRLAGESEQYARRCHAMGMEASRHRESPDLMFLANTLFMEAASMSSDSSFRLKSLSEALEAAKVSGDTVLAAKARIEMTSIDIERGHRHRERAVKDLVDFASERLKIKDYLNTGLGYLAAAEIGEGQSQENGAMAANYLLKERNEAGAQQKFMPLLVAGKKVVLDKGDYQLFLTLATHRSFQLSNRPDRAEELAADAMNVFADRSDVHSLASCMKWIYKSLEPDHVTGLMSKGWESCRKHLWKEIPELFEARSALYDFEDFLEELEEVFQSLSEADDRVITAALEEALGICYLKRKEYAESILWYERALGHLNDIEVRDIIAEARCLERLRLCYMEIEDHETSLFYSQELNALFKGAVTSMPLAEINELGKISAIPFLDLLKFHNTRPKSQKVLVIICLENIQRIVEALENPDLAEHIPEIIMSCGSSAAPLLLDYVQKVSNQGAARIIDILGALSSMDTIEGLVKLMGHRTLWKEAFEALLKFGQKTFEPLLVLAKESPRPDLCRRLIVEMGVEMVEPLLEKLQSEDSSVAATANTVLAEMGDVCLDDYVKCLRDSSKSENVKTAVAELMVNLGEKAASRTIPLLGKREAREQAVTILQLIGQSAIPYLTGALRDDKVRPVAMIVLRDMGKPAVPHLIESLKDDVAGRFSAEVLIQIGEAAQKRLIRGLREKSLQKHCEDILISMGEGSIKALVDNLENREMAPLVAAVLMRMKGSVPFIVARLDDPGFRKVSRDLLLEMGEKAAPYLIEVLLTEEKGQIRRSIRELLIAMGGKCALAVVNGIQANPGNADILELVTSNPGDYVDYLVEGARKSESRDSFARVLAAIGGPAVEPLIAVMDKKKFTEASKILIMIGKASVKPVMRLLGDDRMGKAAAEILRELSQFSISEVVDMALADTSAETGVTRRMKSGALEFLGSLHKLSAQEIVNHLNDNRRSRELEEIVIRHHSEAMGQIAEIIGLPGSQELLRDLTIKIGTPVIPTLIAALSDPHKRRSAADLLILFEGRAVTGLIELVGSRELHATVVEILSAIGKPAIGPLAKKVAELSVDAISKQ